MKKSFLFLISFFLGCGWFSRDQKKNKLWFLLNQDTYFKVSSNQSSQLSEDEKCFLPEGSKIPVMILQEDEEDHIKVKLLDEIPGCALEVGFFYSLHVDQQAF